MAVTLNVKVDLIPIEAPDIIETNCVTMGDYNVKDLPWEVLDKLCNEFRKSLFAKAGKKDSRG